MNSYEKYLKYKNKYFKLQKQYGGVFDCKDENLFSNKHGTCWNTGIQTMFLCSHKTKSKIFSNLTLFGKNGLDSLIDGVGYLLKLLPSDMFNAKQKLTEKTYKLLNDFFINLNKRVIDRYENTSTSDKPLLMRKESKHLELCSVNSFYELFPKPFITKKENMS